MDYQAIRQYIEARLNTNFSTLSIAWDNTGFIPTPGTAWIECTILMGPENRITLGDTYQARLAGFININVYVPKDSATQTALGYLNTLTGIFRGKHFNGIRCRQPQVRRVGQDGEWFQYNISVPFLTDSSESV